MKPITIYIMLNPLGLISSAYTSEADAKQEAIQRKVDFGETYTLEPCALNIDEHFLKRVALLIPEKR